MYHRTKFDGTRLHFEDASDTFNSANNKLAFDRCPFEIDKERIIYSKAFKRLQYKTQVFINTTHDHCRNRLIHSLEVALIARIIAKELDLSEALAESIALAHDLGHTPFGHAGEDALNFCMRHYMGFSHNAHTFKVLTQLENISQSFKGLNLTYAVLDGVIKHNGPLVEYTDSYKYIFNYINCSTFQSRYQISLEQYPSLEAQIASIADDIAYIRHDIEDAVTLGMIQIEDLIYSDSLFKQVLNLHHLHDIKTQNPLCLSIFLEELRSFFIKDLLYNTRQNLRKYDFLKAKQNNTKGRWFVEFSDSGQNLLHITKNFLKANVYHNEVMKDKIIKCQKVLKGLFELYMSDITLLPLEFRLGHINNSAEDDAKKACALDIEKAEATCNYIAGMTDRFALQQYQLLIDKNETL